MLEMSLVVKVKSSAKSVKCSHRPESNGCIVPAGLVVFGLALSFQKVMARWSRFFDLLRYILKRQFLNHKPKITKTSVLLELVLCNI